jgi:Protein of unknown function (DUF3126)
MRGHAEFFEEHASLCGCHSPGRRGSPMETFVKADEIKKLDAYFKRTFNPTMVVKARPRKDDSAEVYVGEEFLGVVFKDDEDGDLSYNFSMAILDVDL